MTSLDSRRFMAGAEHWQRNQRKAARFRVAPATLVTPTGTNVWGACLTEMGQVVAVLTAQQATDLADQLIDAQETRK